MKAKFTALAASLFAFAGVAHAQATDLNYNYLQFGYEVVDFDDFDEDLKGFFVGGSFLVTEEIFGFASYADGETDKFMGGRIGVSGFTLGAGYRYGVNRQTDLNFTAAFERAKVEGKGNLSGLGSDSDNGYSIGVGVRHLLVPEFEVAADVTYVDISDDDTILSVSGLWHINELFAVGLGAALGSDATGYGAVFRFKF